MALLTALAICALLVFLPASASADVTLCSSGSGTGQCSEPRGIAVDFETGHIYVADTGNKRIDVFDATGAFLSSFGSFTSPPTYLAVDNGASSPSHHDLYVVAGHQVRKFSSAGTEITGAHLPFGSEGTGAGQFDQVRGIGVTAAGVVYVADQISKGENSCPVSVSEFAKRVQKFDSTGELESGKTVQFADCGSVTAFAADSTGDFYIASGASQRLRKFDPEGNLLYEKKPVQSTALAVGEGDYLLAGQGEEIQVGPGFFRTIPVITKYTPNGDYLRRYGYGKNASFEFAGLAALHTASGDALFSEPNHANNTIPGLAKYIAEPPPGPVSVPDGIAGSLFEANPLGNVRATLNAEVNPEGKATEYEFQYVDQHSFETEGGFSSPHTESTPATTIPIAAGTPEEEEAERFHRHRLSAQIGCSNPETEASQCLLPETTYRFRVKAHNPDGEGNTPLEGPAFTTKKGIEISATYATEVGTDGARLNVQANPLGVSAAGYFEYVDDASYQQSGFAQAAKAPAVDLEPPESPIDLGKGEAPLTRSVLVGLQPGTTYHYRFLATDSVIAPAQVVGPEHTLATFSAPTPPPSCPANEAFRTGLSALLPDCRAYELVSPLDKEGGEVTVLRAVDPTVAPAVIDQSSVDGERLAYGSYRAFGDAASAPYTSQYIAGRTGAGWQSQGISPPRGRLTVEAGGALQNELKLLSPDLCQTWWRTLAEPTLAPAAVAGFGNLYSRREAACGGQPAGAWEAITTVSPPHGKGGELPSSIEVQGVAADGSAAIYVASDNLTADAPDLGGKLLSLYYESEGEGPPRYVCVLPSGLPSTQPCSAGFLFTNLKPEGRRASLRGAISADGQRVFWTSMSEGAGAGPIYLREHPAEPQSPLSAGKCTKPNRGCTIAVSAAAEAEAGLGSTSRFLAATPDGSAAVFITGKAGSGSLYRFDVEGEGTTPIAHKALGLVGASDDLSRLYLVSEEVLTSGPNADGKEPLAGGRNLYLYEDGAAPSFRFVVTLGAGDSTDYAAQPFQHAARVSPDGDHAAFMSSASLTGYDNADARSGEADTEVYLYDAEAAGGQGKLLCASCNPTGARPVGEKINPEFATFPWVSGQIPTFESSFYAPRVLSADGSRLYFDSTDALTPRDSNGSMDVYQWEEEGTGDCEEGGPSYFAANEGCIDLISSGQSPAGSQFTDASPDGRDVFFTTLAGLLPEDYGLTDVYDARVGGGFPTPPTPAAQCEGEACQSPPEAPDDATPASSSFEGAGNVHETPTTKRHKKKAPHKHKHKRHRRRAGSNRGGSR